jgi:mRNA-degrading endonuclease YafQ of YafQ-DinJ toxin-antitoxin module
MNVNQAVKKLDTLAKEKKLDLKEVDKVLEALIADAEEGSK